MAKLILIVAGIVLAWWILKCYRRSGTRRDPPPSSAAPEDMVRCAHCGVHLPRGESHAAGGRFFCSEEHGRLHG